MVDIASYLLEDLLPFQFTETPIGPAYNGRLVMAKNVVRMVAQDQRVQRFSVLGQNPMPDSGTGTLPHHQLASWAEGAEAVWFEPARHYWWRASAIRSGLGKEFPVVTMLHSLGYPEQLVPLLACIATGARSYDRIIAPGQRSARLLEAQLDQVATYLGVNRDEAAPQIEVVPYGVPEVRRSPKLDAKAKLGLPGEPPLVTYVGRLVDGDKIEFSQTVKALAAAHRQTDFCVVLAGAALQESERQLRALVSQTTDGFIQVWPNISEERKSLLLSATDIFISPSRTTSEMFGLAIVEAMLHECAVLCSAWGGYLDVVENSRTALTIPTEFCTPNIEDELRFLTNVGFNSTAQASSNVKIDYEAFTRKLIDLISSDAMRVTLGREARAVAEANYMLRTTANGIVDVLVAARAACTSQPSAPPPPERLIRMAQSFSSLAS